MKRPQNLKKKILHFFLKLSSTGKSLSEAFIFASINHNMMTDCSLNYKFNTWKFLAQTWKEHVWQKEELLTKIYLYDSQNKEEEFVAF